MNASQPVLYGYYQCICAQRKHYFHLSRWVAELLGLEFLFFQLYFSKSCLRLESVLAHSL